MLTTLGLPENPDALLARNARTLEAAYREVGGRLAVNDAVRIDDDGKIHLTGVKAIEEPPSLVDLRKRDLSWHDCGARITSCSPAAEVPRTGDSSSNPGDPIHYEFNLGSAPAVLRRRGG